MAAGSGRGRGGRIRARHALATGAAFTAGAALLLLVFARPGWDGGPTLSLRVDPGRLLARLWAGRSWLGPFLAAAALLPALRALVWREVHPAPRPRLGDTYHATALGGLVHNTVPGKLGPVAAAFALSRMAARPFTPSLSSQLLAKLLELGAIVALGAGAAALHPSGAALRTVVGAGAAAFAALACAAAALAVGAPRLSLRLGRRFPRVGSALAAFGEGVGISPGDGAALRSWGPLGRAARVGGALALAVLPAAGAALAYALPLRAAGVPASAAGGALVVTVLAFGQFTPGLPVGAGVYWTLSSWAARQLGAAPEDAAAFAVLTHAGMVAAGIAVGAASAVVRRATFLELLRRRREVARLRAGAGEGGESGAGDGTGFPRHHGG